MQGVWRELLGQPLETVLGVLPARQQKAIGRWVRGREEFRKLQRTDHVLMSWGKSGRTWLRVMLSRFYQVAYGIPEGRMLEFDNLHRIDPRIPSLSSPTAIICATTPATGPPRRHSTTSRC